MKCLWAHPRAELELKRISQTAGITWKSIHMWAWFAMINSANTGWEEKSSQGEHLQERIRRGVGAAVVDLKPNRRQQSHTVVKKKSCLYMSMYRLGCSLQGVFSEPSPPFGLCNWAGCHAPSGTQHFQRDVAPWSEAGGILHKGQCSSHIWSGAVTQRDKCLGDMMGASV